jgi:tetraacyldisaccharide 4'-kinase
MIKNPIVRILLWPFSVLYGLTVGLRNVFYEVDLLKSTKFSIPIISIGNLTVGGAGKTPHVEYLLNLLKPYINVGVLSRGYNRSTNGFRMVSQSDNSKNVGDEPLMYAKKYQDVTVAVCESRSTGIPEMVKRQPNLETIILDDAYQHRSVFPDVNILITSYQNRYTKDFLLPMGRLRERKSSAERADIIIVSKCPSDLSENEAQEIISELKPLDYQKVYFSKYNYGKSYSLYEGSYKLDFNRVKSVLLVTAIASTSYLMDYLDKFNFEVKNLEYEDHRYFTEFDIQNILEAYKRMPDETSRILLTTEKDATRLALHYETFIKEKINVFVLPVWVEFLFGGKESFDIDIKERLLEIDK